ncbi:MAG: hypothetical protein JSR37_07035 [Verrucomicrobia bacterium]|nr:hypothetical protein [Verrucomicrobiota bacterium]MBS0636068.1 hypothetical protein [Verrucomicrobiota bacterium]
MFAEYVYQLEQSTAQKLFELNIGMTLEEAQELVNFVEAVRATGRHTVAYMRKEDTHAPRTIEVDPQGDQIFIHLRRHNVKQVGTGAHKVVTTSILYDAHAPKLVACAIVEDSAKTQKELETFELFRGCEGILQPIYYARHQKKSGETVYEIITPLFNQGSLKKFIENNDAPFEAKLKIAQDILKGACALNAKNYVCRDNNRGNFFIHHENGIYSAVLGDLGGYTDDVGQAINHRPFGPSARSGVADLQLAYYEGRLTENDLFSNYVFALGRTLHFLYFEKEVPWTEGFDERYPLIKQLYKTPRDPAVLQQIEGYSTEINTYVESNLFEGTTAEERFTYMIFSMLSTDPQVRKTNSFWLEYITSIIETL